MLISKETVLRMFEPRYPQIAEFSRRGRRLSRTFSYGELQKIWLESVKATMAAMGYTEFHDFCRIMLTSGAIGLVEQASSSNLHHRAFRVQCKTSYSYKR